MRLFAKYGVYLPIVLTDVNEAKKGSIGHEQAPFSAVV